MYFASKPYTMQMMVRPDDAQTGTIPTILDLGSKLQLTLGAADANGKGYPLTLKSASASAPTGIYLKPNAFTSLTLAVDAAGAATVTAVNAEDSVTVVPLATSSAPRCWHITYGQRHSDIASARTVWLDRRTRQLRHPWRTVHG